MIYKEQVKATIINDGDDYRFLFVEDETEEKPPTTFLDIAKDN